MLLSQQDSGPALKVIPSFAKQRLPGSRMSASIYEVKITWGLGVSGHSNFIRDRCFTNFSCVGVGENTTRATWGSGSSLQRTANIGQIHRRRSICPPSARRSLRFPKRRSKICAVNTSRLLLANCILQGLPGVVSTTHSSRSYGQRVKKKWQST